MKQQTRLQSVMEVAFNYVLGFAIAWFIQKYCMRWFGHEVANKQVTGITLLFTIVSVFRSYFCRRLFNWIHARQLDNKGHEAKAEENNPEAPKSWKAADR